MTMISTAAAFAATVTPNGGVSLSAGGAFHKIGKSTLAKPGDKVMASLGGSATIDYGNGCVVTVDPGTVVTVAAAPPCTAGLPGPDAFAVAAAVSGVAVGIDLLQKNGVSP